MSKQENWFEVKTTDSTVYTPYTKNLTKYVLCGSADEALAYYKKYPDGDYYNPGLFTYDEEDSHNRKPVTLKPGYYRYERGNGYPAEFLRPAELSTEVFIELETYKTDFTNKIDDFIANEDVYRKLKVPYKLGILMYGEPGNSKTSHVRDLCRDMIKNHEAVVISIPDDLPNPLFIEKINATLANRIKVFIFEELVETQKYGDRKASLLNFLDGETAIDKCIIVATTNYPQELPGNVVSRPSRIDLCVEFPNPNKKDRSKLIEYYLSKPSTDVDVDACVNMSIAAIKECCIRSIIEKTTLTIQVGKIKARLKLIEKAFKKDDKLGF